MTLPTAVSASDWAALLADDSALTGGVAAICSRHRVDAAHVTRYADGSLPVYAIGDTHVIKLFPPHEGDFAAVEARALGVVHGALPVPTPQPLAAGDIDGWHYILMSQLHGQPLARAWPRLAAADRDGLAYQLGRCVAALHAIDIEPVADIAPRWDAFMRAQRERAPSNVSVRAGWTRTGCSRFPHSSTPGCRPTTARGRFCTPS